MVGLVVKDADGDGNFTPETGDLPLSGVTVTYTDDKGSYFKTYTDIDGKFTFENVSVIFIYLHSAGRFKYIIF